VYIFQCFLPSIFRQGVRQVHEVDEVERSKELIWEQLGDVLLKEVYSLGFAFFLWWEFRRRNIASEDLNIAIANVRQRRKIKGPGTSSSGDVDHFGDVRDVDLRWNKLGISERSLQKCVLRIQAFDDMLPFMSQREKYEHEPRDVRIVIIEEVLAERRHGLVPLTQTG
jgi:hypothetical protein